MNIVILGATKGMGRALARELVGRDHDVGLLGRSLQDVERSANDLKLRASKPDPIVPVAECDLVRTETHAPALAKIRRALGEIDVIVVTAGSFATQEALEADLSLCADVLQTNFTQTILFCEEARKVLLEHGGTLCVFSSVAGDRGRKPVGLYGATKAGLSRYLESLDHRYHDQGLVVVDVKPGFVKTGMTEGLKPPPFAGKPEQVAKRVADRIESPKPVVYVPAVWSLIMLIIRFLPRFVMRRVGF